MFETAENEGLAGTLITIDGVGKFHATIEGWKQGFAAGIIDNTGRGDVADGTARQEHATGRGSGFGKVKGDAGPLPTYLASASGTIKLVHSKIQGNDGNQADGNYLSFSALFSDVEFVHDADGGWDFTFGWIKTGPLTQSWGGTITTTSLPSFFTKEILAGMIKAVDPNDLGTQAVTMLDGVGVGNSDSQENAALATTEASAVTPVTGLKLRSQTLTRTGLIGVRISQQWTTRDTIDDVIMPNTTTARDPQILTNYGTRAAINAQPAMPSGFVRRIDITTPIDDANALTVAQMGLRDTTQDITFPATSSQEDLEGLTTTGSEAQVHAHGSVPADPTPPLGMIVVGRSTRRLTASTDPKDVTYWNYALLSSTDQRELPGTFVNEDPDGLDTTGVITIVHDTATPPADPSPTNDLKIVNKRTVGLTTAGTPQSETRFDLGLLTSAERMAAAAQYSTRSAIEPFTRVVMEIIDNVGSTDDTLANTYWATFQSENFAYRLRAARLNDQKAVIIKEYVNPGKGLVADLHGIGEYQIGRVNSGNIQVYVAEVLTRGSSKKWLRLGRSRKRRIAREFTISRLLSGTIVPDFASQIEDTNNASFLNLAAGEVMYMGAHVRTNIGLSGTWAFYMDYRFLWLSGGHYAIDGWAEWVPTTASPTAGAWATVSSLTGTGLTATAPTQSDFSGFLT